MSLEPMEDRVLLKPAEKVKETETGIVLPEDYDVSGDEGEWGTIISGLSASLPTGTKVLYNKYGGTKITYDGESLLLVRVSDVLAKEVLNKEKEQGQ